ncbi:MAG: DUF3820 family protein [Chlamydiales bacterium]|nr:DUF3820 family protein [Chlamydiales bacterium]
MGKIEKEKFICVDCETTGLDVEKDQIIEVGVALFTFDGILEQYETLVDPGCPISEESIAIHNITDAMVKGQPVIAEVLPRILKMIGSWPIVGHGVKFDIDIIACAAKKHGIPCNITENTVIDTLRLARHYGDSPVNSLNFLARHFNVPSDGPHRAMADVNVNIEVFKHLSRRFQTFAKMMEVLSKPVLLKTMPLGKHKGRLMKEVPLHYLQWAANKDFDQDLLFSIRSEIKKRKQGNNFSQSSNPFSSL